MIAFTRHGQTELNRGGRLQGRMDVPLSDVGLEQAASLGRRFASEPVARVVSSPLRRACQTADAIAGPLGLSVELDDRLVELDYGEWDGAGLADIAATDWAAWRADPEFAPPGGERLTEVTARIVGFLDDYRADDMIVAVSHVSPIKAAVCCALAVDERASWRMQLAVASITRVGHRPDGTPYLASFNELA